jgi:hypothetical protein
MIRVRRRLSVRANACAHTPTSLRDWTGYHVPQRAGRRDHGRENKMEVILIGCLIAVAAYLAWRLRDANSKNAALQGQISSLKRKLGRGRGA